MILYAAISPGRTLSEFPSQYRHKLAEPHIHPLTPTEIAGAAKFAEFANTQSQIPHSVPVTVDHEYKVHFGTGRGTGFSEGTRDAFSKQIGAGDGIRTRNPQLGKLMRYRCATPAQVVKKIINALRGVNDQTR